MKIRSVAANNRKKSFDVVTSRGRYPFPYSRARPSPSPTNKVVRAYVDPELGREGFTFELESGREGSVHVDAVLEYNRDPDTMVDLLVHELTIAAKNGISDSGLSRREISRRLRTSPTQLYRVLDEDNTSKSVRQLLSLLHVLGLSVQVRVSKRRTRG